MTHIEMFTTAKWVGFDKDIESPYVRTSFILDKTENAKIRVCGLGFFELYINSKKVGNDLLVPAYTQYNDRDLSPKYDLLGKLGHHTYVMEYDVTDYLIKGENILAFRLAKGWYDRGDNILSYGRMKLCFDLKIGERHIVSDESLKYIQSDIVFSDIYVGETIDGSLRINEFASAGYNCKNWRNAEPLPSEDTDYVIQSAPTDKIIRKIKPVFVKDNGIYGIFDTGEAISGTLTVESLEDEAEITVRYADALTEGSELDFAPTGDTVQTDIFKNTKKGEEYTAKFCWHAFRYIELTGNARIISVNVIHSDCKVTSDFECDNEVLNWLYKAYIRTQLDNMHCGVPSDCPHIERLGYTGDGQLCAPTAMELLDTKEFYSKWMRDIADCQEKDTGHVQHTAPFATGGGGPAGWGGAIVTVPYNFYKFFGDKQVLKQYFDNMLKYVDYMCSKSDFGLVYCEEIDWCLGDWCAPTEYLLPKPHLKSEVLIPETYVNTALFVKHLEIIKEIADIIEENDKVSHIDDLINQSKHALSVAYYSPRSKDFCGNVQGANGFACDIGLGGTETVKSTCEKYKKLGMFDTGIFATDIIPRILFENGCEQTAFDMLSSRGKISFGRMMENNATTIWEDWYPERSLNHPMFGAATRYLFEYILGIRQTKNGKAYEKVIINPKLVRGLNKAKGHIKTVQGVFAVEYEKRNGSVSFTLTVPETTDAVFVFRESKVKLSPGENKMEYTL